MPRPILPGYTFSRSASRYRDAAAGKFVARSRITDLLEQQVAGAEDRMAQIVQGVFNKSMTPGAAQEAMRDEMRRLNLANNALGKGGIDQLNFRDYGRAGRQLRDTYERIGNMVDGIERGQVTLPQALRRIEGYTIEARNQFFAAQRDAARESGRVFEERRILHARESCGDCIEYAALGWQPMDSLPLPGEQSQCGKFCRCTTESREVQVEREPVEAQRALALAGAGSRSLPAPAINRAADRASMASSGQPPQPPAFTPPSRSPGSSSPTKVGAAVQGPTSGPGKDLVDDAMAALDGVHDDGGLGDVLVNFSPIVNAYGFYEFDMASGKPIQIAIDPSGPHQSLTLMHETGHYIDQQVLDVTLMLHAYKQNPGLMPLAYQEYLDAIAKSDAIDTLIQLENGTRWITYRIGGTSISLPADPSEIAYLLRDEEVFARAYSQYITARSGDRLLLRELDIRRNNTPFPVQWADSDFVLIADAIDAILRHVGWLK